MHTPQRPGRSSFPWLVLTASLLLIAGCVAVLVVHGRAPAPGRVPPGTEAFDDLPGSDSADTSGAAGVVKAAVDLPYGRLSFEVESAAAPARNAPSRPDDYGGPSLLAPAGGSFVVARLSVSTHDDDAVGRSPRTDVSLEDGTRSYPLPVLADFITTIAGISGETQTAVDSVAISRPSGSLAGLSLAVGFDGVTQRLDLGTGIVDDAGVADALAATSPSRQVSCGTVRYHDGFRPAYRSLTPRCDVTVRSAGWVEQSGWAPSGSRYLVVTYGAGAAIAVRRAGGEEHYIYGGDWQVRLGALRPELISTPDDGASSVPLAGGDGEAVFVIPLAFQTPPRVTVLRSALVDGPQPVEWSWSVRLPTQVRG